MMDLYAKLYTEETGKPPNGPGMIDYVDAASRQYRQYVEKLVLASEDLKTTGELRSMDTIDMGSMEDTPFHDGLMERYISYAATLSHPAYAFLPCFEEGVFVLPDVKGTTPNIIHFKVLEINEELERLRIRIRDYCRSRQSLDPGIGCDISIHASRCADKNDPDAPVIEIDPDSRISFVDLYVRVLPKDLGWNRAQARRWRKGVLQNAVDQAARWETSVGYSAYDMLSYQFVSACLAVNAALASNRPVIEKDQDPDTKREDPVRKADTKPDAAREPVKAPVPVPVPERRVRSIGLIRFKSDRAPRPGNKAVRNYKLASWTARGHVRHYKSGKQVYIKPMVKHRKAASTTHAPAPSTIKIVDNRPEAQTETE